MIEDLWPAKGDYDFNNLVLDYQYNIVTNSENKIVELKANIVTRAIGASYKNGFAVQFDGLNSDKITAVSGAKYHGSTWLNNASNGTENRQTFASIVIFDDAQKVLPSPGSSGSNIIPANPRVATDTTKLTISFVTETAQAIGTNDVVINPYIIVNQNRENEVQSIPYTHTTNDFVSAYLKFAEWAQSNGTL